MTNGQNYKFLTKMPFGNRPIRSYMNEMMKLKENIVSQLNSLCAHCATGSRMQHRCPAKELSARVQALRGVPLIVNSEFKGVLWK